MRAILLLIALLITIVHGKQNQRNNVLGQSLNKKDAKALRNERALQRSRAVPNDAHRVISTTTIPMKRRLAVRRQLPDYGEHTQEPTVEPTEVDPSHDEYYDDDAYESGKGKGYGKGYGKGGKGYGKGGKGYGKGGMMGMMSGGKGKGGKGKGGKGGLYPTYDDFLDDKMIDDEMNTDECQMVTFNETFVMPGPTAFIAPDTTAGEIGTAELPGTVFITEQVELYEVDGVTPIVGSTVTGTCTRTTIGDAGGGICQFVFIDEEGFSISVDGYLPNPLGGPLAISGGTGSMVGVFGQFDLFPIFATNETADVFIDVLDYEVIADIGIIVCPP